MLHKGLQEEWKHELALWDGIHENRFDKKSRYLSWHDQNGLCERYRKERGERGGKNE